jgi:hypothetical protein
MRAQSESMMTEDVNRGMAHKNVVERIKNTAGMKSRLASGLFFKNPDKQPRARGKILG